MEYGDILYVHGAATTLKPLDAFYHRAILLLLKIWK